METLELTRENAYRVFIEDNLTLPVAASRFGLTVGTFRKHLARWEIKKAQKDAVKNTHKTFIERYGEDGWSKLVRKYSPEAKRKGAEKRWETRRPKIVARYASEGITEGKLRELYIDENQTLKQVGEYYDRTPDQARKILKFFRIVKSPEKVKESRRRGLQEFRDDPVRLAEAVRKFHETCLERYGDNWYYNHASKLELEVFELVKTLIPDYEVINGDYTIIRRPGSGGALQLDIYVPELQKAIEVNGEYWHDRDGYERDLKEGTMTTREALKDSLCREKGISLLHVWDKDWLSNQSEAQSAIQEFLEG